MPSASERKQQIAAARAEREQREAEGRAREEQELREIEEAEQREEEERKCREEKERRVKEERRLAEKRQAAEEKAARLAEEKRRAAVMPDLLQKCQARLKAAAVEKDRNTRAGSFEGAKSAEKGSDEACWNCRSRGVECQRPSAGRSCALCAKQKKRCALTEKESKPRVRMMETERLGTLVKKKRKEDDGESEGGTGKQRQTEKAEWRDGVEKRLGAIDLMMWEMLQKVDQVWELLEKWEKRSEKWEESEELVKSEEKDSEEDGDR